MSEELWADLPISADDDNAEAMVNFLQRLGTEVRVVRETGRLTVLWAPLVKALGMTKAKALEILTEATGGGELVRRQPEELAELH